MSDPTKKRFIGFLVQRDDGSLMAQDYNNGRLYGANVRMGPTLFDSRFRAKQAIAATQRYDIACEEEVEGYTVIPVRRQA